MADKLEPADPDFATRLCERFRNQPIHRGLAMELVDVSPGHVRLSMPFSPEWTQQNGYLHAGIVTTGLDSACGFAAFSLVPGDADVLSVEFKTNLLAPARGQRFEFEGRVVKPGRTIIVCDGRALATGAGDEDRRLVATMTATLMCVRR